MLPFNARLGEFSCRISLAYFLLPAYVNHCSRCISKVMCPWTISLAFLLLFTFPCKCLCQQGINCSFPMLVCSQSVGFLSSSCKMFPWTVHGGLDFIETCTQFNTVKKDLLSGTSSLSSPAQHNIQFRSLQKTVWCGMATFILLQALTSNQIVTVC